MKRNASMERTLFKSALVGLAVCLAGADLGAQTLRGDKLPSGLRRFSGHLVGKLVRKKKTMFLVHIEKVLSEDKTSKASAASEAVGRKLVIDVYRNYKTVPKHARALAKLKSGQKIRVHAAHLKGTRLSVVGRLEPYRPPPSPAPVKSGEEASFFGVTFKTSKPIDPKLLSRFRSRWADAEADAKAGRLEAALKKARTIRDELPEGLSAVGLDRSIEHLKKQMAMQSASQQKVQKWNRLIQEATAEENAGRYEGALVKIKTVQAEGAASEALARMRQRLEWKVANGPLLQSLRDQIDRSRKAQAAEAMAVSLAELKKSQAALPETVKLPLLEQAISNLEKRLKAQAFLNQLAERLSAALADEQEGRFAEALKKIQKIRSDLPEDIKVDTRPIDEAEA
ncbi:MAG: hypothetical protein R3236_04315, partial [Phycisphaeraceae bacterium]|nr:hypothetical protein [Phycisphaeraceae bacterium]